jgi:hypothetical protein
MLCGAINLVTVAARIRVRIAKSGSRTISSRIDLYPSSVFIRSGFENLRVLFQRSRCMLCCLCCLYYKAAPCLAPRYYYIGGQT